ncbi:MAG: hypothetical protein GX786_11035 [Clostridiales bacterium]|nr:hypothetical protein [Clostridiales bacterium]
MSKKLSMLEKETKAAWLLFRNLVTDYMAINNLEKQEICKKANVSRNSMSAYFNNLDKFMAGDRQTLASLLYILEAKNEDIVKIMMACEAVHIIAMVQEKVSGAA